MQQNFNLSLLALAIGSILTGCSSSPNHVPSGSIPSINTNGSSNSSGTSSGSSSSNSASGGNTGSTNTGSGNGGSISNAGSSNTHDGSSSSSNSNNSSAGTSSGASDGNSTGSNQSTTPTPTPTPPVNQYVYNAANFRVNEPDTRNNKVLVGVIDSGTIINDSISHAVKGVYKYIYHTDGTGNITNLTTANASQQDLDPNSHGTLVSEIIAAKRPSNNTTLQTIREGQAKNIVELYVARTSDNNSGMGTFTAVLNTMLDLNQRYGVRIFNNSSGVLLNAQSQPFLPTYTALSKQLVDKDVLQIFAAGNHGSTTPTLQAYLPIEMPELEKGYLVVAGMNSAKTALNSGSNHCGFAERYCLAADYTNSPLWDPKRNAWVSFNGTSGAAPQVTAVAANVASKYPWMSADQIRQTILTTATFINDGSQNNGLYNKTYGWGYFNPDKALNGPALFSKIFANNFEANVSTLAIFSNNIQGDAGLIKNGSGTLALTGYNTYSGTTTVNQGELRVNGSVNSSVSINSAGVLSGTGSVGSVYNNGQLSTEKGRLTINGSFSQTRQGTLAYGLEHYLKVNGSAALDGNLTISAQNKDMVASGEYVVVDSRSLSGSFKNTTAKSSFLKITGQRQTSNQYTIQIAPADAAAAGTVREGISRPAGELTNLLMAEADQQHQNGRDTSLTRYVRNIQQAESPVTAQAVLNSNAGALFVESPSVLLRNDTFSSAQIAQRSYQVGKSGRAGVWLAGGYLETKNKADGWDTVDSDIQHLSVGADTKLSEQALIGAYASTYDEKANYTLSNGSSKLDVTTLGVYGQYRFNPELYFSAGAHYGFGDATFNRTVTDSVISVNSSAKADLDKYGINGELGYRYLLESISLSPYVGLSHQVVSMDGLKESSHMGVHVNELTSKETKAHVGVRTDLQLTPQLSLTGYSEYAYAVDRNLPIVTIASQLADQLTVNYQAPEFDKDYLLFGAGLNYSSADQKWNFFGDIHGNALNSGDYQAQLGIKYLF